MSENQPEESAILQELRQINTELGQIKNDVGQLKTNVSQIKEGQTALQTKVEKIETALYGTGNPHGGLFQQFAALTTKVDSVEKTLTAKIEGVEKNLDRIFSFAKWAGGIAAAMAIPIFIEVVLPIVKKWIEN